LVISFSDRMNIDEIRTFVAIAQLGGFSRAADRLHRSQPAISRRIGLIEQELGAPLFERAHVIGARSVEDPRLVTGQGTFTADRIVPGALHVAFRRSDQAHARISGINTAPAADMPGVFAIYTAQDLHDLVEPARATSRLRDYHATALYPLAREKVPRSRFRNGAPVRHSIRQGAADLAGQPSAIEGGLTHYWGGVGLQWTLRWRKRDSNDWYRVMRSRFRERLMLPPLDFPPPEKSALRNLCKSQLQ
jgi:hypothetical protein